jgi:hypothetical protein
MDHECPHQSDVTNTKLAWRCKVKRSLTVLSVSVGIALLSMLLFASIVSAAGGVWTKGVVTPVFVLPDTAFPAYNSSGVQITLPADTPITLGAIQEGWVSLGASSSGSYTNTVGLWVQNSALTSATPAKIANAEFEAALRSMPVGNGYELFKILKLLNLSTSQLIPIPPAKPVVASVVVSEPTTSAAIVKMSTCRHVEWLQGAINGTVGVSELVAVVDRDYMESDGAQWSEPGFTVPEGTVFWTDLFSNALPEGVRVVRTQGGWGVYVTSVAYIVPKPNGGGRFTRICEGIGDIIKVSSSTSVAPSSPVASASPAPAANKPQPTCVGESDVTAFAAAADPVASFDSFYEKTGYQYGKALVANDKIPVGLFLGTFQMEKIPAGVTDLSKGTLWRVSQEAIAPKGGRWMPICK